MAAHVDNNNHRLICWFLASVLLLPGLNGCGGRSADNGEVISSVEQFDRRLKSGDADRLVVAVQKNPHIASLEDEFGDTPLILAAYEGHRRLVQVLVSAGANLDTANRAGTTPLAAAAMRGHTDVVRDVLAAGADPQAANSVAIEWAIEAQQHQILEILTDADVRGKGVVETTGASNDGGHQSPGIR